MQNLFSKYGEITSAVVMKDSNEKSRGFGFVCFKDPAHAMNALSEHSDEQGGLYVREALSKEQRQMEVSRKTLSFKKSMQYLSLHVRGFMMSDTIAQDLGTYFGAFGQVKNIRITGTGAALVSFMDRESTKRAKDQSHGAFFNGYRLEVAYFEPKELRDLHKAQEFDKRASEMKRQRDLFP